MKLKSVMTGLALTVAAASAQSAVITIYDTNVDAEATSFIDSLQTSTLEDFNGLANSPVTTGSQQEKWMASATSFDTAVGTFSLVTAGKDHSGDDRPDELKIESSRTGEYGRESLASDANDLWLDSNDAREVVWDIDLGGEMFNALGFYLADPNDQGGRLELTYADGTTSSYTLPGARSSGSLFYTTIVSDILIADATLTFGKDPHADGWGIDDVVVGTVPEPGTLALMGLGLAGLGFARRRKA
ncbi:MAG: PEP-CTERM sorting domain-containing protein [Oleiphilaceae bacterium]|nr:PEP-CTERM sorting domain-containing protein [Oleiphilaceae bacterium]